MSLFAAATTLLAVDPGLNATGWSTWARVGDSHQLLAAGLVQMPASWRLHTVTDRSVEIARQVLGHAQLVTGSASVQAIANATVIELPQQYAVTKGTKGDPNDLIDLAALCGTIAGALQINGSRVAYVRPREWKGQTPKDCTEERARARLQPSELARVQLPKAESLQHNVWDAVGIGLWATGRK